MILPGSASLVLSAVQQLIKLGNRLDSLMAQCTAVQSQLVLSMPSVRIGDADTELALITQALAATASQSPDPFGTDRALLQQLVANPTGQLDTLFAKYFPDQVSSLVMSPDAAALQQLQQNFPGLDWTNPGVRIAAFAIAAGPTDLGISYTARMALAVADTLLEFGADNTALFVRDPKLQGVVQSVLQRFAQPDWAGFTSWNLALQTALKATLNAALDVGTQLPPKNPWLDAVLDTLANARAAVPAANQDNYLLGLVQGEGFPLLLSQGLLTAANKLDASGASSFKQVAADVLQAAAPIIQNSANPDLGQFFSDHWGDLLRAGLTSLDKHGDALLAPGQPLLNSVLTALVQQLANTPNPGLVTILSSDSLYRLADTAITAVAQNPAEVNGLTTKPWLAAFINSVAQSAQQLTAKNLFTADAADAILRDAIGVVGKYPNLIVSGNGLPVTLVGSVFTAVSQLPRLDARTIGETAVRSALTAIANDPTLAAKQFGPVVTAVATQLAADVGAGKFTADQAAGLASAAIAAIARNPQIYAGAQTGIASAVLSAVNQAFSTKTDWIARLLVETANQTLLAVARNGASSTAPKPAAQLGQLLTTVLSGGLATAATQLGTSTDLDGVAPILGGLVAQALQGNPAALDPTSPQFTAAFNAIAAKLGAT
ncbi:MAG TPA: hypothetical protein VG710_03715 [Opitutus sp.]|nr:hypothetical protein [Opitutus sp.]